jgi:hypothetical protein
MRGRIRISCQWQLFAEQLDLQIKFLSAFVGEKELTVLPN